MRDIIEENGAREGETGIFPKGVPGRDLLASYFFPVYIYISTIRSTRIGP